jgi:hypothetical protein
MSEGHVEMLDEICSQRCKCGGTFTCAHDANGQAFVLHTLPHCEWCAMTRLDSLLSSP